MSVLRRPLNEVVRGWLDLNGPVLGPAFYLFESVRSYIEERKEAFDARFGTDTAAPFLGRDHKPGAYFYVATTASLIYEILNSLALPPDTFAFVDMGSGKGRALLVASEFAFAKIVGIELSPHLHRIARRQHQALQPGLPAVHAIRAALHGCRRLRLRPGAARAVPVRSLRAGDAAERRRQPGGVPGAQTLARPMSSTSTRSSRMCCRPPVSFERSEKAAPRGGPGAGMWSMRRQEQAGASTPCSRELSTSSASRVPPTHQDARHCTGSACTLLTSRIRSAVCNPTSP